jgi:intein/homing endonuclease
VVEGTEIQTPDGLKEIQDFNVGEKVITQYGEKEVKYVWNPDTLEDGNPECFEIEFEDGYKVTCSAEHKFIVDGDWVEAKNLIADMDCAAA